MTRRSVWLPIPVWVLTAVVVAGCGSTAPTTVPASPSPAAAASAPVSAAPDLTPATSPTPVPGTSAGAEDGLFRTVHVNADGSGELPIVLQDLTGLVVGIAAVAQGEPPFDERVSNPAGQPNVLRYQWTGGACDTLTSITFERLARGLRVTSATTTSGGICIAIGLFRGIDIHLSAPIDADSVIIGNR